KRDPHFPDVPTMAEAGYPGVDAVAWVGLFAPAGTPPEIGAKLNKDIDRSIHEPAPAANLDKQGIVIAGGPPEVLGRLVDEEIKRWTAVARQNHISVGR